MLFSQLKGKSQFLQFDKQVIFLFVDMNEITPFRYEIACIKQSFS